MGKYKSRAKRRRRPFVSQEETFLMTNAAIVPLEDQT